MSYSVCFKCGEMVGYYQKYCSECEQEFKQDKDFWKRKDSYRLTDDQKRKQLLKDLLKEATP